MEDIAEGARRALNYIEKSGSKDRNYGYLRAVRQFVLNAQRGDDQGMANVLEALTKINANCCDLRLVQIRNQAEPSELIPMYTKNQVHWKSTWSSRRIYSLMFPSE